jgi:hypothetical protein
MNSDLTAHVARPTLYEATIMLQSALKRTIGIVTLVALVASIGKAEDEPWGYLFELRNRRIHYLKGESVKVGRLAEADVVLRDSRVSRRHAEIHRGPDGVVLLDVGSTNGTRRNGERVLPGREVVLAEGDVLIFGYEKLVYHEDLEKLWDDAVQHSYLARFVRLRVPVLSDRTVNSLGRERLVRAVSQATFDEETRTIKMSYPDDAVRELEFRPEEMAFVGDIGIAEGELRVSLWGLAQEGSLVSRRAALSHLKHGELRLRLAAASRRESRAKFETSWSSNGIYFLFPLLESVVESLPEEQTIVIALKLVHSLVDQDSTAALSDAIRTAGMLHRHAPDDPEPPTLAALAGARWVKLRFEELRRNVPQEERSEFSSKLASSKAWLEKAAALDADRDQLRDAEGELAEAEEILSRMP